MRPKRSKRVASAQLAVETLEPRLAPSGTGLTAQYFHNADFTGLADTRTEAVNHNWGSAGPGAGIDGDSFSVRWAGQIEPAFSELYTFRVLSDEGVRVWVDGQLIVNDWSSHIRRFRSGTIQLAAGQRYDIRVEYFEGTGPAQVELSWSSESQPLQIIPADRLYTSPTGLLGSYRDAVGGALARVDPGVDFEWGTGSPHSGLAPDGLHIEWSGQISPDYSDEYTFTTTSDDGVRLWIGGELVIDRWEADGAVEGQGTKRLEGGKWHDLRLEYREQTADAHVELRWSSPRQTGTGTSDVVPPQSLRAMKPTPVVFKNPLGPGADPFVIQWQEHYYMTRSQGNAVWINRAQSLEQIHAGSGGSDTVLAWSPPPGTLYSRQIWAPEIHRLGDNWYIYVAASDGNNATHRMHVLERLGPDPFGPFTYKGQITAPTDRWAIDGTVFEWQDALYFVWSGWPGFTDGRQDLYIAQMQNPWTLASDRVLISTPIYTWETHGLAINEGPQVLVQDGRLHIIYSASGYWTPQYALGRLTYNGTGSLLDPGSWSKVSQPVFRASDQVVGVGHASFVKSPDGTEDWMVYHAHANPSRFNEDRVIHLKPFTFSPEGTPDFGMPLPPGQPFVAPSTGPESQRPDVPGDYDASGSVDARDRDVWSATFGMPVFPGTGADGNGDGQIDAADYVLWRNSAGSNPLVSSQTALVTPHTSPANPVDAGHGVATGRQDRPRGVLVVRFPKTSTAARMLQPFRSDSPAQDVADLAFDVWEDRARLELDRSRPQTIERRLPDPWVDLEPESDPATVGLSMPRPFVEWFDAVHAGVLSQLVGEHSRLAGGDITMIPIPAAQVYVECRSVRQLQYM
jgi:GH43 family beta-xylosidase